MRNHSCLHLHQLELARNGNFHSSRNKCTFSAHENRSVNMLRTRDPWSEKKLCFNSNCFGLVNIRLVKDSICMSAIAQTHQYNFGIGLRPNQCASIESMPFFVGIVVMNEQNWFNDRHPSILRCSAFMMSGSNEDFNPHALRRLFSIDSLLLKTAKLEITVLP